MTFVRQTLRQTAFLSGRGLHGGQPVHVAIHPSQSGIAFRCGAERVAARPENVTETTRCTRLGGIGTIEHLMAALAGLEVTDAEIELDSPELPALDGSAIEYVEALRSAGLEVWGEGRFPGLFRRVFLQDGDRKVAVSAGEGHWRYAYRAAVWPFFQVFESNAVAEEFSAAIAPARTFGHAHEVEAIRAAGLAQGLTMDSALVIGDEGYVNAARFEDEPARHKLLDAMGDLYLAGIPLRFLNVVAEGSGHRMNVETAALLAQAAVKS